ncbi:MAG: glycoside hydrolase domain-containing protein [Candidatus Brocadiia bacterium]
MDRRALWHLGLLLAAALPAAAGTTTSHTATVSAFAQPPRIDGRIEPGEWDGAVRTTGFQTLRRNLLEARGGAAYCGFSAQRLYIAVVSELPPDGELRTTRKFRDSDVVFDDSIEIWLDPNRDTREQGGDGRDYYQFIGNAAGVILDTRFDPAQGAPELGWNGDWEFRNGIHPEAGVWVAELSLPFADLGWKGQPVGRSIGVLIARNWKRPWSQTTWFPHKGAFVSWFEYPRIHLTEAQPSVQVMGLGENVLSGRLHLQARIVNPGPAREVEVRLAIASSDMPGLSDEKTLELPANAAATYDYRVPKGRLHADATHSLNFVVRAPGAKGDVLNYALKWTQPKGRAWHVRTGPNPEAAVRLATYPSYEFIRLRIDTRELEAEAADSREATVTVTTPQGDRLLQETMTWQEPPAEAEFKVGDLPDGEYRVTVALKGRKEPLERSFQRIHFVWEGNRLGVTNEVYPPFEPLRVEGRTVAVVLRQYTVGGLGLWRSVASQGRELLAGPVALKTGDGRAIEGEGTFINVVEEKRRGREVVRPAALTDGATAVYEGQAEAPGVRIATRCTTDFDGCMKVELTLAPPPGDEAAPLDRLWLEIPLRDAEAPLWHCCTAGLRRNPAGFAPRGEGKVWDSTEFPDGNWYGNFKPYIWLGGEERGVCWFADNDRGWVLDVDEKARSFAPCLSLHRGPGVLALRVHLVQKPITLTEPRQIVFGLMASPAKPMPEGWRRVLFTTRHPGFETIGWMGSTYWGCAETMHETYPLGHDMSILNKMQEARLRRSRAGFEPFVAAWRARHLGGETPPGTKTKEQILSLVNHSLGHSAHEHDYYNVYWEEFHSVSRHHIETQVFGNEWSGGWGIGGCHALAPSYLDFQCWYAAEFIRRGIGLYFDNTFPKRAYDPVTTAAYRLPSGDIQPSANMWRHREYLRRVWTLHHQLAPAETRPLMMLHMTNTHIVPYMGWNHANLDLEWFYGPDPQQAKYPHDLLRAESIGRQTGNLPLVLARVQNTKSEAQKAFAERTRFGTMMVHEIKFRPHGESRKLLRRVLDFGYGLEGCRVLNYWDQGYPVEASDPEVKSLLLQRGTRLLLVLCTWSPKPETVELTLDLEALGLRPTEATDGETGEQLPLRGDALAVPLEGYGVRLVHVK